MPTSLPDKRNAKCLAVQEREDSVALLISGRFHPVYLHGLHGKLEDRIAVQCVDAISRDHFDTVYPHNGFVKRSGDA
jgi:predicted alpha/beta-fold hydrolase